MPVAVKDDPRLAAVAHVLQSRAIVVRQLVVILQTAHAHHRPRRRRRRRPAVLVFSAGVHAVGDILAAPVLDVEVEVPLCYGPLPDVARSPPRRRGFRSSPVATAADAAGLHTAAHKRPISPAGSHEARPGVRYPAKITRV